MAKKTTKAEALKLTTAVQKRLEYIQGIPDGPRCTGCPASDLVDEIAQLKKVRKYIRNDT